MVQYRNEENWSLFSQWSNGVQHWWEGYRQLQSVQSVQCALHKGTLCIMCRDTEVQRYRGAVEFTAARYWVTGFLIVYYTDYCSLCRICNVQRYTVYNVQRYKGTEV